MSRSHSVKVTLSDRELARLDELRGHEPRAVHLRRFLYEPPSHTEVSTHAEVLALLSRKAREGSITAAVALERALRARSNAQEEIGEAIDRILSDDG
jgi:hypothetical protein